MIYFNENDPFPAQWLTKLYPEATVDDRSIHEVEAKDVYGKKRAHFFGGIGGWEYALKLAGWPVDREVWTGSAPCPPFSAAGKKKHCPMCRGRPIPCPRRTGYFICLSCEHAWHADARHLWPEFWRLIRDCRPATVFGEQVGGQDGRIWLAGVRASLERIDYSFGAADIAAAGVGSPQVRQRLWWVAHAGGSKLRWGTEPGRQHGGAVHAANGSGPCWLANANGGESRDGCEQPGGEQRQQPQNGIPIGGLADAASLPGSEQLREPWQGTRGAPETEDAAERAGSCGLADCKSQRRKSGGTTQSRNGHDEARSELGRLRIVDGMGNSIRERLEERGSIERVHGRTDGTYSGQSLVGTGRWGNFNVVYCRDGKYRRFEPGSFPLADGVSARVGRLRGYGNSICPQVAAEFITAFIEVLRMQGAETR